MRRSEAIKKIFENTHSDALFIFANGRIGREAYVEQDRKGNFYMLSSMGKAASIGLGVAMNAPEKQVVVVDGDGNALMNMDNFAMVGYAGPTNMTHIVLDNKSHDTTGGQESLSTKIDLSKVAEACGYANVWSVKTVDELGECLEKCKEEDGEKNGPSFVLVDINKDKYSVARTPHHAPEVMRDRFMEAVGASV